MTQLVAGLLTWSAQTLVLVTAAAVAALTLANAKARLVFWQGLLVVLLLLPAIEPWQSRPILVLKSAPAPMTASVVQVASEVAQSGFRWRAEYWIGLIAIGAALRLLWIGVGFLRLRRYRNRAALLPEPPFPFDSSSARWYVSETVPGPVTYGWLRPSILLPARVMQLSPSLREAIACHELVHVHRRDWLFVLAEETIRCLLWFHPAVWFALSRIQLAREQAVDSEVVSLTENRDVYLDALVEVAAHKLCPDLAPAPLFLRKRHLAARVAAVLKEASMSKSRIAARLAAVCSAMLLAARVAIWVVPFVSPAQIVLDDPGVTVDAGAMLLHRVPVRHPAGANGTVTVEASLNSKGEVTDAHVLSGPDDLRKEALSSVLQWHYSPGLSRVQISMRFDPAAAPPPPAPAPPIPPPPPTPRSVNAPPPPPPPPPPPARRIGNFIDTNSLPQNTRLKSLDFVGFSPEAEKELRNRLPFREGDIVTGPDFTRALALVTEFDSHAALGLTTGTFVNDSELLIGMRISLQPGGGTVRVPRGTAQVNFTPPAAPSSPETPGARIGPGMTPPVPIYSPQPDYSDAASKAKFQGTVRLSLLVDPTGKPTNINVVSPLGLGLDQKAIEAVERWRFKPGTKDGQPVSVQASIEVNFRLPN